MQKQDRFTILSINKSHAQTLRLATLYNVNWEKEQLTLDEMDAIHKVAHYYNQWNELQDFGFIVYTESEIMGVAWLRFFDSDDSGYGFIQQGVPELSICTFPNFRNMGIGKLLLQTIIDKAMQRSLTHISLTVEKNNTIAYNLYQSFGFKTQLENKYDYVMLLTLDCVPLA